MRKNILERQFQFRRAVLEVNLPVDGGKTLALMNTHLDAFAQGDDTMTKQVAEVDALLFEKYNAIPELEDTVGEDKGNWFTHLPNRATALDRTIDYFFYSDNLVLIDKYVRQHDTLEISDHLPVVAVFQLP